MAEQSTEQKPNNKRRGKWNIVAILKAVWKQHKREKPLGKAPSFRQSFIAIIKTSCEYQPAGIFYLSSDLSVLYLNLGLNVLLIFIPLSVRVF